MMKEQLEAIRKGALDSIAGHKGRGGAGQRCGSSTWAKRAS